MMKKVKRIMLVLMAICVLGFLGAGKAQAASAYSVRLVTATSGSSFTAEKIGKYYWWYEIISDKKVIKYSTKYNGAKAKQVASYTDYLGTQAVVYSNCLYYSVTNLSSGKFTVYRVKLSGGKPKQVFSVKGTDLRLVGIYGGKFYLNCLTGTTNRKFVLYSYTTKTKKLRKIASDCQVTASIGNYALQVKYGDGGGVSNGPVSIYKLSTGKLVKKFDQTGYNGVANQKTFIIWSSSARPEVWSCKPNGKGKKTVVNYLSTDLDGSMRSLFGECLYYHKTYSADLYRYIYSTGKSVVVQ